MTTEPTGKTPKPKRSGKKPAVEGPVTVRWELADLPSAQHRAGLAGLVLMAQWLPRSTTPKRGVCEVVALDADGATLRFDEEGMGWLFDELYAASWEENVENQIRKNKQKQEVAPKRTDERVQVDPKTGKEKRKTVYVYDVVVPRGGVLVDAEPNKDERGPWVRMWRNMVWTILRGKPATRAPFEARADKARAEAPPPVAETSGDGADAFAQLAGDPAKSVDLPSTYYLGAMARTAENVGFRDRARQQFLLHFWPYAAQVYVPEVVDPKEGRKQQVGFALAIPEVSNLEVFCAVLPEVLRTSRKSDVWGFRPREALIDLALESALDLGERLRAAVSAREGGKDTSVAMTAVEVLHVDKQGNNVNVLSTARIAPTLELEGERRRIREGCVDPMYRRQRLLNLLAGREWWWGFDRLFETTPYKSKGEALRPGQGVGASTFCRDAREQFRRREETMKKTNDGGERRDEDLELAVWDVVKGYVNRRAASRLREPYDGLFDKAKADPGFGKKLQEEKQRVAMDAFLQVRGRQEDDFTQYFAETLCSVPQFMNEARYRTLHAGLRDEGAREKVRTLTLLALSAARWVPGEKKSAEGGDD